MEHERVTGADNDGIDASAPGGTGEPDNGGDAGLVGESGEPRVDAAVRALRDLDQVPLPEHPAIFEAVHGQLVEVLGELHPGSGPADRDPDGRSGGAVTESADSD